MPLSFSILMANYNNGRYIEHAIKSVISQTYPHWELIIVDDNSTDNSLEIIKPFLLNNKIKLILHKKNKGYGSALRTAAVNASNDILAILDADDALRNDALEIISKAYQKHPECGFIYSTMYSCDSNLENCKPVNWIGPVKPKKTNIFKNRISHFKTFRKDVYLKTSGFDPNMKKAVDKDIIYKLEEITEFHFVNERLYFYRQHIGGISQGKNLFSVRVYHYIAKCKAYKRRLNKNIPNLKKWDLYKEYFKITFYKMIQFYKKFQDLLRIKIILNRILNSKKNYNIIILTLRKKVIKMILKIF
ncbi:MAG: glycosyltransferase family 2 protein [Candidatus Helarchaeota archaeon]